MADTPWTPGPYLVAGNFVYALEEFHDNRGRHNLRNRITIQVDGGPDTPKEEVDAVKALLSAAPDMDDCLSENIDTAKRLLADLSYHEANDEMRATLSAMIDDIEGVLAKARGEQ